MADNLPEAAANAHESDTNGDVVLALKNNRQQDVVQRKRDRDNDQLPNPALSTGVQTCINYHY
jgi:hypothetical protein